MLVHQCYKLMLLGKKHTQSSFLDSIKEDIVTNTKYEMTKDDSRRKSYTDKIPFLPGGRRNHMVTESTELNGYNEITNKMINKLPWKWRRHWMRINFERLYEAYPKLNPYYDEITKPEEPEEPGDDNYFWQMEKHATKPVDIRNLSKEAKERIDTSNATLEQLHISRDDYDSMDEESKDMIRALILSKIGSKSKFK